MNKVYAVGIGPGDEACMTQQARAAMATANIRAAAELTGIPYRRLSRRLSPLPPGSVPVKNAEEAVRYLRETEGNVLLTTGSRDLPAFSALDGVRLYLRVLPSEESLTACARAGIPRRNIIAMQGPFSRELNLALIRQFSIRCPACPACKCSPPGWGGPGRIGGWSPPTVWTATPWRR